MKTATLLFTYNRSSHTKQVLEAIKQNTVLPQKLFLFQDGLKQDEDASEWEKVNAQIHNVGWCDNEVIVSEHNKGLAKSIVSGIGYAFKEYDAVIVLEDDCVAASDFINFMEQCFEKYQDNKRVYTVSGYSYPVDIRQDEGSDVYFCGRISSWGWGTWKDRWEKYEQDYTMLQRLKFDKVKSAGLALWGRDLEEMLVSRLRGNNDSWAVFWAMKVIEEDGICINPYRSLIRNIGCDGSGVNCGITDFYDVALDEKKHRRYMLPDTADFSLEIEQAFAPLFGSYTAARHDSKENACPILVYGVGNCFFSNEKEINERYDIVAFVDKYKKGCYAGREIVKPDKIKDYEFEKIVIMVQDEREVLNIANDLVCQYGIPKNKIEKEFLKED